MIVEAQRLPGNTRKRLKQLLAESRPDPDRWMDRLRQIGLFDNVPVFAVAVRLLAHLDLANDEAEGLLRRILVHRERMASALGRDPGIRVAAADFLCNIEPRLSNPTIVEWAEFEKTARSAVTDPLTGLYNRRYFRETLEREILRSRRYDLPLSILMLDLDGFKRVNDAWGHLFGDMVLERTGRLLGRAIRQADVGCRYGGEEFAVVLPETDRLGAFAVGERVRRLVESSFAGKSTGGKEVSMTVSGGIASHPEDGRVYSALLSRSDEALYRAKARGRNRIALHHSERRNAVRYPARIGIEVQIAMANESQNRSATAVNISRNGALLHTRETFRTAEQVRVRLGGEEVLGRIVRVESAVGRAIGYRVGIAFETPMPDACIREQAMLGRPRPRHEGPAT